MLPDQSEGRGERWLSAGGVHGIVGATDPAHRADECDALRGGKAMHGDGDTDGGEDLTERPEGRRDASDARHGLFLLDRATELAGGR